ncbi:MAG TPA: hypothetical protein DIT04_13620 [Dysgonomonas sp.]|nr:hypothetical protein [Dysgonomonas sp.]
MKKKIIIISLILVVLLGGYLFLKWLYIEWNRSDPRAQQAFFESQYKSIWFENRTDSVYYLISFDFHYSNSDSLDISKSKMDSLMYYTRHNDTVYLSYGNNNKSYRVIPILSRDSVPFPKTFNIKIYKQNQLLKDLDYDSFRESAIPEYMTNEKNFLTANQWTLVIDSTLLDLK